MSGPWLAWSHCMGSLRVEEFPTLDVAIRQTFLLVQGNDGRASISRIEGPMDQDELDATVAERWAALEAAEDARFAQRVKPTHVVELRHPASDEWGAYSWCTSEAEATEKAEKLRTSYPSRVQVRGIR